MKHKIILITVSLGLVAAGMFWFMKSNRPTGLSLSFSSHIVSPSIKRLVETGRVVVQNSISGRNEGGSVSYLNQWSDELHYEVVWYDILAKRAYGLDFSVFASELATLDKKKTHATITIEVGPGADVTVTTANPKVAQLIAEKRDDELWSLSHSEFPPAIVRKLCARPLPLDDPATVELVTYYKDYILTRRDIAAGHLDHKMAQREQYIQKEGMVSPRCLETGGNR